jgi:2-C-methyl-D-erythritol 4-phosphate cytidylyltransferase
MASAKTHWAILPAAGIGSRMQADRPKQYLPMTVKGITKTVIEYTLDGLLAYSGIDQIAVIVSPDDSYWKTISSARGYDQHQRILVVAGGSERCYSVLNGLLAVQDAAKSSADSAEAWVAVHDVARPCITHSDLDILFSAVEGYSDGGLLATPVRDTMKRGAISNDSTVSFIDHTVDRDQLWHALTPQMFPLASLLNNLQLALNEGFEVTDEASAMEFAGAKPKLVNGRSDNLKITRPEDLKLAEFYLNSL